MLPKKLIYSAFGVIFGLNQTTLRSAIGILMTLTMLSLPVIHIGIQEQDRSALRTWTDRTGKFSTRAVLVRIEGDSVELRKEDGVLVKLALDRLSDADQAFLHEQSSQPSSPASSPATPDNSQQNTLGRIRSSEQKLLSAKKIADEYRSFLALPGITDSDRLAAERRLAELEPEAARDAVLIGNDFRLLEEIMALKKESEQAIDELVNGPPGKDGKEVLKLLKEISRKDPVSCRANFLLGIGFAVTARNFDLALDEFQECIRRLEAYGSLATAAPDLALPAMYNNLAIIQIRLGRLDAALKLWEAAAGDAKSLPPALLENFTHEIVFINGSVASDGLNYFNSPEPTTLARYRKFAARIGLGEAQIREHNQHGWQYLNLTQSDQDPDLAKIRVAMVDVSCLNCNGSSRVQCKKCGGDGVVIGKIRESQRLPTGHVRWIETSVNKRCEFCDNGSFDCRACDEGVERLPN